MKKVMFLLLFIFVVLFLSQLVLAKDFVSLGFGYTSFTYEGGSYDSLVFNLGGEKHYGDNFAYSARVLFTSFFAGDMFFLNLDVNARYKLLELYGLSFYAQIGYLGLVNMVEGNTWFSLNSVSLGIYLEYLKFNRWDIYSDIDFEIVYFKRGVHVPDRLYLIGTLGTRYEINTRTDIGIEIGYGNVHSSKYIALFAAVKF